MTPFRVVVCGKTPTRQTNRWENTHLMCCHLWFGGQTVSLFAWRVSPFSRCGGPRLLAVRIPPWRKSATSRSFFFFFLKETSSTPGETTNHPLNTRHRSSTIDKCNDETPFVTGIHCNWLTLLILQLIDKNKNAAKLVHATTVFNKHITYTERQPKGKTKTIQNKNNNKNKSQ